MTRELTLIGVLATLLIVTVLGLAVWREPARQADAEIALRVAAVTEGMDLFAENCAVCHGAQGEGLGTTPALNSEAVRSMDYETLFKTIARGRYGTKMAAYSMDEGGILTNAQIDALVTLIQYANWDAVAARVDALGLTPPEAVAVELSEETLASVRDLPDGDVLAAGLEVYATECAACHGANAEGTSTAPALDTPDVRALGTDELTRIVQNGVAGTLMAGWDGVLTPEQIAGVVQLVERWDELQASGVELPQIEVAPIDMSPEAIARGQQLFSIACSQCHGADGYGTRMAPALNSQQFLSQTSDAAIQQIIAQGVPGTVMPAWGGRLSEADIAAIVAYLRSLEPTAPEIVTQPQTAVGGTGRGGGQGGPPWLR